MVSSALTISESLALPLDVVTEATAIVATRGAGKSSTSAVFVEEGFGLGVQAVVLDRTGVYHGLRSSKTGKSAGLGVYVLGGPHGDAPLEANAGILIADLVVDSDHSFVLDLSDFSKNAAVKFAADFLERLYDRKARARTTTLLVIDEAHFYAPQTPRGGFKGDSARLMGAMEDVVGLGRSRGLGVVLTTQRTQALNKAILDLIETLIVMRMLSPRAREAVRAWIQEKHEEDELGVIPTLDSLPTGEAWVWSPLRGILERVKIRRIHTFDSYATPKPGEVRVEPTARAELDLAALGEQIRATAERAKENDPTELRKRLFAAEKLARGQAEEIDRLASAEVEPRIVEVFPEALKNSLLADSRAILGVAQAAKTEIEAVLDRALTDIDAAVDRAVTSLEDSGREPEPKRPSSGPRQAERAVTPPPKPARPTVGTPAAPRPESNGFASLDDGVRLKAGARRMLAALARLHPTPLTRIQLGTLADISPRSGTFSDYLSALRRNDLIEENTAGLWLTEIGLALAGDEVGRGAPNPSELKEMWERKLKAGARRMLDALFEARDGLTRDELAEKAEISRDSGTFSDYLSSLRRNNLLEEHGGRLYAGEALFIGARR